MNNPVTLKVFVEVSQNYFAATSLQNQCQSEDKKMLIREADKGTTTKPFIPTQEEDLQEVNLSKDA